MSLGLLPLRQFFDGNGDPLSGGLLYTYIPGTSTPKAAYTTSAGDVAQTNPVVLNSRGEATVWLDGQYDLTLNDSADVLVWTLDDVSGVSASETSRVPDSVGGTADAITASFTPAVTAHSASEVYAIRATAANATTTPTFSPDGVAAKTITKHGNDALVAGEIAGAGHLLLIKYDATNDVYELLNPAVTQTTLGVSAFAQTLLDDADAATARATLGVIPGGTSRPATVQAGELWRDTDYGTNQVGLYYYDGTDDILVVVVDTAANTSLPSGIGVSVTHNMASDADYTLTTAQNAYGRYIITDTTPNLTTGRNIVVSTTEREFTGQNDTAEVLTFKTSGGTGVAVYPGTATRLYCDGTNVVVPTSGRLIYETEVTGSAVSSIDTGAILDINTHKSYTVELEVANATASTINVYLYYNNDTTVTNYYYDIIDGDGGTITGFRGNAPAIAGIDANGIASLTTNVRLTAGYANAATHCVRYIGSSIKADFVAQAKTNATVSNITQLTVGADVASSFAVGCKLRIYRNDI